MSLAVSFCSKKKWRVAEGCKVPHNSQTCRQEQVSGQVAPTPGRISVRCGFLQKLTCWLRFQVYSPQLVSSCQLKQIWRTQLLCFWVTPRFQTPTWSTRNSFDGEELILRNSQVRRRRLKSRTTMG